MALYLPLSQASRTIGSRRAPMRANSSRVSTEPKSFSDGGPGSILAVIEAGQGSRGSSPSAVSLVDLRPGPASRSRVILLPRPGCAYAPCVPLRAARVRQGAPARLTVSLGRELRLHSRRD